jgi:hypothetical protein
VLSTSSWPNASVCPDSLHGDGDDVLDLPVSLLDDWGGVLGVLGLADGDGDGVLVCPVPILDDWDGVPVCLASLLAG